MRPAIRIALEDATRGGAAADRAGLAVVAVGTVRGGDAVEAVTLHDTGEALALGGARDVDRSAGLEGGAVISWPAA
jgi:beta-phosphoglucomutase-like phosphatase (HAD superfamily)